MRKAFSKRNKKGNPAGRIMQHLPDSSRSSAKKQLKKRLSRQARKLDDDDSYTKNIVDPWDYD